MSLSYAALDVLNHDTVLAFPLAFIAGAISALNPSCVALYPSAVAVYRGANAATSCSGTGARLTFLKLTTSDGVSVGSIRVR